MIPKLVAGAVLPGVCLLYQRLFECWNLRRLVRSYIAGEKVSGRMQQLTSARADGGVRARNSSEKCSRFSRGCRHGSI
jgi:hypothetical protein